MHSQDQDDLPARTTYNTPLKKKTEPRISVMYHQVKITRYVKKHENLIQTWRRKKAVNRNRSSEQMLELVDNFKITLINMLQNLLEKDTVGREMENFRKDVETLKKSQK